MRDFLSQKLNSQHKKSIFCCGQDLLDTYIHKQAKQDIKRKLSVCFVISDDSTKIIKGYYTLSNSSIPLIDIPSEIQKKLPKSYTNIPTVLLGRLAVDTKFQSQGIGRLLLIDALKRSFEVSKTIGSFAVITDPIDFKAEQFYTRYGFIKLPNSAKMFLPMKTVAQLFQ